MKTDTKNRIQFIIISIIFTILFSIILFTELTNLVTTYDKKDVLNLCLSFLAILFSSVGLFVSIICMVVKIFNQPKKKSGGKNNGKKK